VVGRLMGRCQVGQQQCSRVLQMQQMTLGEAAAGHPLATETTTFPCNTGKREVSHMTSS
jgi:hypothetical protein